VVTLAVAACSSSVGSHAATSTASRSTSTTTVPHDEEGAIDPTAVSVTTPSTSVPVAAVPGTACRPDPLANVYHPTRLRVIQACVTVTGTVRSRRVEDDGDAHVDVALDDPFVGMLVSENFDHQHGWLVVEIVPADRPGCTVGQPPRPATGTYDYGICTGANVPTPNIGDHVSTTGPYVLDTHHGWAEIHPAWWIGAPIELPATTTPPITAPPQTSPPTTAPPTTSRPASSTNIVHPGAFCAPAGATGVTTAGTPMVCGPASDGRNRWHAA
jgi:hypothetical protein